MAIGDVNSQERGAGARYNDGKVPLDLIPVWILAQFETDKVAIAMCNVSARGLVANLGDWQCGEVTAIEIIRALPLSDAEEAAKVFGYGAKKYAAWNWIKGMPWSVPLGCALRHCFAIMRGEEIDPESGLSHRGHLVCNLIMLAQFEETYQEGDDRPLKWLSTDAKAAPSGGSGYQEACASPADALIELPRTASKPPFGSLAAQSDSTSVGPLGGLVISSQ